MQLYDGPLGTALFVPELMARPLLLLTRMRCNLQLYPRGTFQFVRARRCQMRRPNQLVRSNSNGSIWLEFGCIFNAASAAVAKLAASAPVKLERRIKLAELAWRELDPADDILNRFN